MKVTTLAVTISQTLNVGDYESVKPTITITAELEDGDKSHECMKMLHAGATKLWARQALIELNWVHGRRSDANDVQGLEKFKQQTKGTKAQLKSLLG